MPPESALSRAPPMSESQPAVSATSFRNGTNEDFRTIHVFKHREDIPLTEFIYRLENSVINSNSEWAQACSASSADFVDAARNSLGLPEGATTGNTLVDASIGVFFALMMVLFVFFGAKAIRRRRSVRLAGPEENLSAVPAEIVIQKAPVRY
ncbi:hypothetical protein C8Q76DRAFT_791033 [Earliella scabrosa]|nr:hypothetical protein C8Q76DRAFT_791033 [Earliella scabrosa]